MGYLDDLYDRVSGIPMPGNNTVLYSAYLIATIAYDLRVALWIADKDEESIVTMINIIGMVRHKRDKLKKYTLVLAKHPFNLSSYSSNDLLILNDSITYLQDVLEELKIEYREYCIILFNH
jgi:hypothetical protein